MQAILCDKCEARVTSWVATSEPDMERLTEAASTMQLVFTASMPGAQVQPHLCYDCMVIAMEQALKTPEAFILG